jgi:hypothetical protein
MQIHRGPKNKTNALGSAFLANDSSHPQREVWVECCSYTGGAGKTCGFGRGVDGFAADAVGAVAVL